MSAQRRSRHPPATSPEERVQHRLRSAEAAPPPWSRGPVVWGSISTTTPTILSGLGFSVSKFTTGVVIITFDNALDATPIALCTSQTVDRTINASTNTTTLTVQCRSLTPANAETTFSFAVYLP